MNAIDADQADGTPSSPPRPRRRLAAMLTIGLLTAGVATVPIAASHRSHKVAAAPPTPTSSSSPTPDTPAIQPEVQGVMCMESTANPHCAKQIADLAQRTPVPATRRRNADALGERISALMPPSREGPCEYFDDGDACSIEILPPTTAQVRTALHKAGYSSAVIRTARPDDPAPTDSLLIAVPTGTECVLLYADGDTTQSWTAGELPDGTCLH